MKDRKSVGLADAFADVVEFNRAAGRLPATQWGIDPHDPKVEALTPLGKLTADHAVYHLTKAHEAVEKLEGLVAPQDKVFRLRARLLIEELTETLEAAARGDEAETADGLADLIYVALDACVAWGIDIGPVWTAVQTANMAKFPICPMCGGEGEHSEDHGNGAVEVLTCPDCGGVGRIAFLVDGKVVKPPDWPPPDIAAVLAKQRGA